MRLLQSEIFRALCMIIVGALVIRYRQETLTGITVAIGILFFLSGLISTVTYIARRRQTLSNTDVTNVNLTTEKPSAVQCIVGIGCMLFGIILAFMPEGFLTFIEQILAILLIIGSISQMITLAQTKRIATVHWTYWIFPILIFLIAILVLLKPLELLSSPLLITGWCMMLYGVIELTIALKVYLLRRKIRKEAEDMSEVNNDQEATENTTISIDANE